MDWLEGGGSGVGVCVRMDGGVEGRVNIRM
jgi:hypothetical protein